MLVQGDGSAPDFFDVIGRKICGNQMFTSTAGLKITEYKQINSNNSLAIFCGKARHWRALLYDEARHSVGPTAFNYMPFYFLNM